MKALDEDLSEILLHNHVNPSHQRLKILEYLACHRCHPFADQIYNDLHKDMPTISKSTVYSTLKTFVDSGILREITIDDDKIRYEYNPKNHGHFKCEVCGTVYDFTIDIDAVPSNGLNDFEIKAKDIYFKGICKKCLSKDSTPKTTEV